MTTINDLCVAGSFSPDDKLPMWSNANGVTRALPISVLTAPFLTQDSIGLLAASATTEIFTAGDGIVPNTFVPGTTTTLSLANSYLSGNNIEVFFDASFQGPDQFFLSNTTLVFNSPIPVGVQAVYIRGGAARLVGAPSDGTVTDAKLALGSKVYGLVNYHWRVRTDTNTNYDGVDQSTFGEAPVYNYSALESFGWSMRNSKHTAKEIYQSIFPGQSFYDGVQGVTSITNGSAIGQATGIAGYVKNASPVSGINGNGVAVFGAATAEVNNAAVWGVNTLLQDSAIRAAGTGTGRIMLGAELDFNVMNPGTEVIGVSIGGNSLAQSSNANGYIVNSLGNGNQWSSGFLTIDGAAFIAMSIGRSSATGAANTASQPMYWQYNDYLAVAQNGQFQMFPNGTSAGGTMQLGGTAKMNLALTNGDLLLATGHVLNVAGNNVVGNRVTGWSASSGGSRAAITGSSTLPQVAAGLAQLIADLTTHGLIGA
jgi:hypothetical protein